MRVLFDQGVFDLRNMGNVALLQVAVERIGGLWPEATLDVLTSAPHVLRLYCPGARAVRPIDVVDAAGSLSGRLLGTLPPPVLRLLLEAREAWWNRRGAGGPKWGRASRSPSDTASATLDEQVTREASRAAGGYRSAASLVHGVDLVVATGAQYMSDACRDDAFRVLDLLQAASQRGIPTAMVGQGIGPFDDLELRARAMEVYPLVDLVFVRDRVVGLETAHALGVAPGRAVFTGDDAVELAYEQRSSCLGTAIGVSLRMAHYTGLGEPDVRVVADVLGRVSAAYGAKLFPVPISFSRHELDERILGRVTGTHRTQGLGWRFRTPRAIVRTIGRCRVVVTGTFHTAVFALAQGIPAVGLARSRMYVEKFESLVDQFGAGCQVVSLDDPRLADELEAAVCSGWGEADRLRPALLATARQLVSTGYAAYRRLQALVESRAADPGRPARAGPR